jgi:hypothetical protein
MTIEFIVSGPVPELVSVTVCAVLVVPVSWEVKVKLEGERPAKGMGAVTVTEFIPVEPPYVEELEESGV